MKKEFCRMTHMAFTLAEVLITLAIIGVVAAVSIPSVVSNSQQQEFKTGLRKAVSVLNSAITMNMAIDGESPYENKQLIQYLTRHMSVLKTTGTLGQNFISYTCQNSGRCDDNDNAAFYTADGMRFEFNSHLATNMGHNKLHESDVMACDSTNSYRPEVWYNADGLEARSCGGCGSMGLNSNPNNTTKPPCIIMVDVNGDKKPTPGNVNCKDESCGKVSNLYKVPLPGEKQVRDIFSILITEDRAIPYGVTAQKAMYNSRQ
ncbi:MAG: type II secretion system protein [bacterium]|nr:type II secretion system protein [bacterium]